MQPGQCTLPPDVTGRVLDRLVGLEQIIPPAVVRQVLAATGRTNPRRCRLTHEVVCWVVLAMGILTDLPIRQVFKHARRLRVGEKTPIGPACAWPGNAWASPRSASCSSRWFIPWPGPRRPGPSTVGSAWWVSMARSTMSPTRRPTPPSSPPSAGPRGDGAFPQIRKLSLVELGTHVEFAFVVRSIAHGEQSMVGGLLRHLTPEMLLLEDRGFFSYDHWKEAISRGVKLLARVKSGLILRPIQNLADGSYLAKIYRSGYDRQIDRDGIVVRVIRYTLDDPQRVGHGEDSCADHESS